MVVSTNVLRVSFRPVDDVWTQPKISSLSSSLVLRMASFMPSAHCCEELSREVTTFSANALTCSVSAGAWPSTDLRRMNWQRQARRPVMPSERTNSAGVDVEYATAQRTRVCVRRELNLLASLIPIVDDVGREAM